MAQMRLAADRLHGERRGGQEIVRAMHAALGRRLLVLLNSHDILLVVMTVTDTHSCQTRPHLPLRSHRPSSCIGAIGQRQQQFVLDQRRRIQRMVGDEHFVAAVGIQCVGLGLAFRRAPSPCAAQSAARTREAALAFQRHLPRNGDGQCRPPASSVVPSMRQSTAAAPGATRSARRSDAATSSVLRAPRVRAPDDRRQMFPALVCGSCAMRSLDPGWLSCRMTDVGRATQTRDNSRLHAPVKEMPAKTMGNGHTTAGAGLHVPVPPRAPGAPRLPFVVAAPDVDETPLPGEAPVATALRLSEAKARAVAARFADALVIGSDQVADCDGRADRQAGRPRARSPQLRELSGRTVVFHTGVALVDARSGRCRSELVDVDQHVSRADRRRDRRVSRPRAALRLRGLGTVRSARHRAVRAHRQRRSDRAHRPAADRAVAACCAPKASTCWTRRRCDR